MIDLEPACHQMVLLLRGVGDEQLAGRTPCEKWNAGDLVDHVDQRAWQFAVLADGTGDLPRLGDPSGGENLVDGWREDVARHVVSLIIPWSRPTAWQGSTEVGRLTLTNDLWGKWTLIEMVVHGWDLASATGQPFALPEPTLRACLDNVAEFTSRALFPDVWRLPVGLGSNAPLLDQILAITGRRV
jgi:uncharacterized protein (TIGR03086 family)